MICNQFEQLAPQIAHDELHDAKLLQDAANHAASCAACNFVLADARELAACVASLAAHDKSLDSAAHLEFTLRAAFSREHAADTPSRKNVFVGATFRWAALLLAAAIILAVVLFPRIYRHEPQPDRAAVAPPQSSSPAAAPLVAPAKAASPTQTTVPATPRRFTAMKQPKKNISESETTLTGFLALPYADDFSTIEYGAIVRLQMSRSDLAWYGLPVPISDSGEKIVADLFVNGSGTPEAIRLVR